jgi:glycosyltransferase involved in cell wall biosynthesis
VVTPPEGPDGDPGRPAGTSLSIIQTVRSDGFAGVERYICQVTNAMVGRGHQVVVIGGDPERMHSELDPGIEHVPASSVPGAVRALLGHRRADIVHAHMTAAETAAWLAHPVQRAPIVATRHFAAERGSSRPARLVAAMVSRSISLDIAISQFVASSIEGPSVLLPNGVPDRDQAPLDGSTVLMLQRLRAEKSPELGVAAFAESGLASDGWRLVVAGVGDLRASLGREADRLGVADTVEFVGQIADTDRLLDQASVLLAPAPDEPFGLSVVEAMAHGVPVVAAGGGAHVETVGSDGLLFPPGDAATAARALVELARDRARRHEVGTALRRRQQQRYSLDDHVVRLVQLYRQIVAGDRPSQPG